MTKSYVFATAAALFMAASGAQANYWEIYGGSSLGGQSLNYGPQPGNPPNLQPMDAGPVFGGGYYFTGGPLQYGVDVMFTNQDYTTWGPGSNLSTISLMANARASTPVAPAITGYAGAGIGAIQLDYDDPNPILDGTDIIAGYQVEAGLVYDLGAATMFTSVKYQAGFDEGDIQTESVEYNSTSVLVGIRW